MTSLYDTVVTRWRAAFPARVVDQFLAEEGTRVQAALADAERVVRERGSQHNFQQWLDAQAVAGRDFDEGQLRWLDWMREDITAHGGLSEDFSRGRCAEAGGAERATRVFGRRTLSEVVASLNATLGRSVTACGCGGRCGGCKPPSSPPQEVSEARLAELMRGVSPETADEFAAYDVLADTERRADGEPDEAVLTRLMGQVDAHIARGEGERPVIAKLGLEYIEARAEAILLRGAGWDAVSLLLERPAIAIVVAPFAHVVAVRDAMGRLTIHPGKTGTLNHLFASVRKAEEKIVELHEVLDLPVSTRKHLPRFAAALWSRVRELVAPLPLERAVEFLVTTLPNPSLAKLRVPTRSQKIPPGSLAVLPLEPGEAEVFDPEHRYALTLRLPNGLGFMFTFGDLADPSAEDLRDSHRLWAWRELPDTEAVLLARDLDWTGVAAVLGLPASAVEGQARRRGEYEISESEGRGLRGDWEDWS